MAIYYLYYILLKQTLITSNIFNYLNKFKIGDFPIDMKNKIELTFKRIGTYRTALDYLSPEILTRAQFRAEFITNKTDIWLVMFRFFAYKCILNDFDLQI